MALLNIIKEPNELLRKKSRTVDVFDDKLHQLIDDMRETNKKQELGAGLAAVQVGVLKRVFIVELTGEDGEYVEFINPVILKSSKNKVHMEGCLSIPGRWETVKRPTKLTVEFQDRYGNKKARDFDGYISVVIGHEFDHLEGILFTDKIYVKNLEKKSE